jgi:LysR family transcriptional regulator, glycine cleavage system transcriptional activator
VALTPAAKAHLENRPLSERLSHATARYGVLEAISQTLFMNSPAKFT